MHQKRKNALNRAVTFNQVRNSVGILVEVMEEVYKKHQTDSITGNLQDFIIQKLRMMGKNVARTFSEYWTPDYKPIDEMLISIYKVILGTKVSVSQPPPP
ncbi:MAG: hypothetical protein ACTSXU_06630, partial [Promethearchaeota archaeon]